MKKNNRPHEDSEEKLERIQRRERKEKQKAADRIKRKKARQRKNDELIESRKRIDLIHGIVLLPGLVFQFLQDFMIDSSTQTVPPLSQAMRLTNVVAVPPLLWLTWKHYSYELIGLKLRKEAYHKTTLLKSSLLRNLLLEWFANIIHSPPGILLFFPMSVNGTEVYYSFDSFVSILALSKLYIVLRIFQNYTEWNTNEAIAICRKEGFNPDFGFTMRCFNRSSPAIFLLFMFGGSVILFGFAVQNFERQLGEESASTIKFSDSFWNSMWCMILTMTTVGYGEIFPVTVFGRIFTIIACIWGMFSMSMIIVTLSSMISLNQEQELSYNEINRTDPKTTEKIKKEAVVVIQSAFRYVLAKGDPVKGKPQADFKTRLATRLEFIAITKRSRYKRLNVMNANPQLMGIIEDLKARVKTMRTRSMANLNTYKQVIPKQVAEIRHNQFLMDGKMLKMYDVTMRLNSFVASANRGQNPDGNVISKLKSLYNPRGVACDKNPTKEFLYLLDNAREETEKFFNQFNLADKEEEEKEVNEGMEKEGESGNGEGNEENEGNGGNGGWNLGGLLGGVGQGGQGQEKRFGAEYGVGSHGGGMDGIEEEMGEEEEGEEEDGSEEEGEEEEESRRELERGGGSK